MLFDTKKVDRRINMRYENNDASLLTNKSISWREVKFQNEQKIGKVMKKKLQLIGLLKKEKQFPRSNL